MRDESEPRWTIKPDKDSGLSILYHDGIHYRGPDTKEFLEAYLSLILREELQQQPHHEQQQE
jgi:hypothetical protein